MHIMTPQVVYQYDLQVGNRLQISRLVLSRQRREMMVVSILHQRRGLANSTPRTE